MITVNALKVRNNLGEILELLNRDKEPILVSKGKTIQAVLITPELFQRRFLDYQAEARKKALRDLIEGLADKSIGGKTSLEVLRALRGYESCSG